MEHMTFEFHCEPIDRKNNQNQNKGKYVQLLYGNRISENPVPVWTADDNFKPFVKFDDPKAGKTIGLSKNILSYGLLALAAPGGGKTNLLHMITAKLLSTQDENDKLIVFDTKGDYYHEFMGRIPKKHCIVIGAASEYEQITSYHNIFAEIMPRGDDGKLKYTEECVLEAFEIAKQLYSHMQSETQPIFPSMAEQIITGLFVFFMRTYWQSRPDILNNRNFIQFVTGCTNEELRAVFELDYMRDFRNCVNYISGKGNQTQGVNSYLATVIRELFVGPFAANDPQREFSMREVIESSGKGVVFVEYDLRRGETLKPMYGLMMDRALSYSLGGRHQQRNNVYFIWDEMLLLPKLRHMSNALNFGRSQGVKILCGLQNVSGLSDVYGETGAKRVLASFQNIISFHNTDYDTRQFLIDRLGSNYQNISYSAQQMNHHVQREGHTIEDWDILSLKLGEAVVSLKDEKPFFFTMPKYE